MKIGYRYVRFVLVMSSLSPIFLIWAVRGVDKVDDHLWIPICLILFSLPNIFMKYILYRVRKSQAIKVIVPCSCADHKEELVTYLLAMMLPLIESSFTSARDAAAAGLTTLFTVAIFTYMNLHYMNLFLIAIGYRLFEVRTEHTTTGRLDESRFVVITKRQSIDLNAPLRGYRLGAGVLMEVGSNDQRGFFDTSN